MVEEDVKPSCFFFLVDVDEPHYLLEALNGEIQNIGKRPWILSFNLCKTILWILIPLPFGCKPMSCK
jgi:hypothetical protein